MVHLISAGNMPVVRNRAVIHVMDWFKNQSAQLCDDSFFTIIQVILTDSYDRLA